MIILLLTNMLSAQILGGTIINDKGEILYGATVMWDGAETGTVTDENGYFELNKLDSTAYLNISYVGYESVLVEVLPEENNLTITINGIHDLMEIEVAAKVRDNYISTLQTLNIETIGSGEFRKAPCCNLAESFQTNASVDVMYGDAVTGAREIQLLGLRGTYTQMLVERRPALTGLGTAFSMEYLPGTWLNSIQISKGASTVQNGYQSITGQINTELVKPFEDKRLFVNLYGSTFGRGEANVHLNHRFNEQWSSGLLLHASTRKNELDNNNDNFYDTPQKTMYDVLWRTFYRGKLLRSQFNVHALTDRHTAGQISSKIDNPYRIQQNNERIELFAKSGYLGFKNPNHTAGFIANAAWHKLDGLYGLRRHTGLQKNAYLSGLFSTYQGEEEQHKIDAGVSYLYDNYQERFFENNYNRIESVPGAFVEYSYLAPSPDCKTKPKTFKNKFGVVVGARIDYHNLFGWLFTPRANVKYNFSDDSVVRLSAGRGYRTANVIAENIRMLASNRSIVVLENLQMEDAWNMGANYTQNFTIGERDGSFSADLYRTDFNNQVVMDMDSDYQLVQFYNLNGKSFANSFLGVLSYEVLKGLDMKVAYKFNDVKITYLDGILQSKPLVAKHRGLVTLDYKTPNEKWEVNTNMQLVGQQRFADLLDNPVHNDEHHTGNAPAYALFNAQLTYNLNKNFELYGGCENIGNFTQTDPIIDWQNPFGDNFDATHIYAPITGAMGYIGLRYGIE